jgi:hypothetical protein
MTAYGPTDFINCYGGSWWAPPSQSRGVGGVLSHFGRNMFGSVDFDNAIDEKRAMSMRKFGRRFSFGETIAQMESRKKTMEDIYEPSRSQEVDMIALDHQITHLGQLIWAAKKAAKKAAGKFGRKSRRSRRRKRRGSKSRRKSRRKSKKSKFGSRRSVKYKRSTKPNRRQSSARRASQRRQETFSRNRYDTPSSCAPRRTLRRTKRRLNLADDLASEIASDDLDLIYKFNNMEV